MMDHNNNNKTKERGLVSRALRRDDSGWPFDDQNQDDDEASDAGKGWP